MEPAILSTKSQLSEYFQGKRKKFDLPKVQVEQKGYQMPPQNRFTVPYYKTGVCLIALSIRISRICVI